VKRFFKEWETVFYLDEQNKKPSNTETLCFIRGLVVSSTSRSKFNVHGSVHRNNIIVYKSQQDAHVTEFIFV
jgi:hypothetical protein